MTIEIVRDQASAPSPLARLREPFPESEIRYLPRVWCRACRDSRAGCSRHAYQYCKRCDNKITTAHIDLRYVGHAEATNRLLNVDPTWTWEPVAYDASGLPQYDANGGLWIRLTVCGVTRLGYGNAEGKRGGDAVKEIIGDAIRNAGMRFGMALDLWTSSELEIAENGPKEPQQAQAADGGADRRTPTPSTPGSRAKSIAGRAAKATSLDAWRPLWAEASDGQLMKVVIEAPDTGEPCELGAYLKRRGAELKNPDRDFVTEARKCSTADAVWQIHAEARAAGLGERELGWIASVGKSLAGGPLPPKPDGADGDPVDATADADEAEAEAAEAALRAWAETAGLPDIAADFEGAKGMPLDRATAQQIRAFHRELAGPQAAAS
jgi:hypothetical protein